MPNYTKENPFGSLQVVSDSSPDPINIFQPSSFYPQTPYILQPHPYYPEYAYQQYAHYYPPLYQQSYQSPPQILGFDPYQQKQYIDSAQDPHNYEIPQAETQSTESVEACDPGNFIAVPNIAELGSNQMGFNNTLAINVSADLNFIKSEFHRMIGILDKMQDRWKAVNSSLQNCVNKMSKGSHATSSAAVLPPTKSKVRNESVASVVAKSQISIKRVSFETFDNENMLCRSLGLPVHILEHLVSKTHVKLLSSCDGFIHNCTTNGVLKMFDMERALNLFDGMRALNAVLKPCHVVRSKKILVLSSPLKYYTNELEDKLLDTSIDGRLKYVCTMLAGYMTCGKQNKVLTMYWKMVRVFDLGGVLINDNSQSVIGATTIILLCISSLLWGQNHGVIHVASSVHWVIGHMVLIACAYITNHTARPQMLAFMLKYGRYADECLLFFPATLTETSKVWSICSRSHNATLTHFQVIMKDHIASGLCYIQLFLNSSSQQEIVKHLKYSNLHFEEGLTAQHSMNLACILLRITLAKQLGGLLAETYIKEYLTAKYGHQSTLLMLPALREAISSTAKATHVLLGTNRVHEQRVHASHYHLYITSQYFVQTMINKFFSYTRPWGQGRFQGRESCYVPNTHIHNRILHNAALEQLITKKVGCSINEQLEANILRAEFVTKVVVLDTCRMLVEFCYFLYLHFVISFR